MKKVVGYKPEISNLELYENCINTPYCEGYSRRGSYLFQYDKITFEHFKTHPDWSTVLPLKLGLLHNKRRPGES